MRDCVCVSRECISVYVCLYSMYIKVVCCINYDLMLCQSMKIRNELFEDFCPSDIINILNLSS